MEFAPANLGHGTLQMSSGTLYTVPSGNTAMMRSVVFVNTSGSAVTISLRIKIGGGTARNVIPPGLTLQPYNKYDDNSVIVLPQNSTIEGEASTADVIDYIISGVIA